RKKTILPLFPRVISIYSPLSFSVRSACPSPRRRPHHACPSPPRARLSPRLRPRLAHPSSPQAPTTHTGQGRRGARDGRGHRPGLGRRCACVAARLEKRWEAAVLGAASTGDDDWPGRRLPTARARRRPVAREDGEGAATPHGDGGSPRQLHTVTARARRAGGAADEEGSAQAAHGRLRGARAAAPREGETERKRGGW
ncbi:hypothetical protein U9M48_040907, partial [Paspalum notatum var. saurae]